MTRIASHILVGMIVLLSLQAAPLVAQSFPTKPIKLLVGAPAGAGQDVEARQIAAQLAIELGQPVIVENKPGFSGMLSLQAVAQSPADGYTLATVTPGNAASHPRLYDRPLYNVEKDIVPISLLAEHPWVLYVNSHLGVKTLAEFIALAKSKPGKLTYASTGVGSFQHITTEWFQKLTGIELTHVPYGASNWQTDFLAGTVDAAFWPVVTMADHVKSGKVRALAISSAQRSAQLPEVPTFAEAKVPEFAVRVWFGLGAPAGVPAPVLTRLGEASMKAAQSKAFREFTATNGMAAVGSTSKEFIGRLASERTQWRKVIAEANIKLE